MLGTEVNLRLLFHCLQALAAALGGFIGWFLGGFDGLLFAMVAFTVIDYITGVMCAAAERRLSSEIGYKGIFKKVAIFALIGAAHTVDAYLIGAGSAVRTAVLFFFISNEGISLLENASRLGLPVPAKLKMILLQFKGDKDMEENGKAEWETEGEGEKERDSFICMKKVK